MGVFDDMCNGLALGAELGTLFLSVFVLPARSVAVMIEDDDAAKHPRADECGSPDPAAEVAPQQVSAVRADEDRISRCCRGQLAVLGEGVEQEWRADDYLETLVRRRLPLIAFYNHRRRHSAI